MTLEASHYFEKTGHDRLQYSFVIHDGVVRWSGLELKELESQSYLIMILVFFRGFGKQGYQCHSKLTHFLSTIVINSG